MLTFTGNQPDSISQSLEYYLPERVKNEAVMRLKPKKLLMLITLDKCVGNVRAAAKAVNINRVTHYRWLENDPVYKAAVNATMNVTNVWNEEDMLKSIEQNGFNNIILYKMRKEIPLKVDTKLRFA